MYLPSNVNIIPNKETSMTMNLHPRYKKWKQNLTFLTESKLF